MNKKCLFCQTDFEGKSTKKFCSDKCRVYFDRAKKGVIVFQKGVMTVPADSQTAKTMSALADLWDTNNTKTVSHKLLNEFSEIIGDGKVAKFFEYAPETGAVKEIPSAIAGVPVTVVIKPEHISTHTPKEKSKEVEANNQEVIPAVPKYDFTGDKFLNIEKYTQYPMAQKPANPVESKIWLGKKKLADQEIKNAWNLRNG